MAGHWRLNKLIVLFDDNGISIDVAVDRRPVDGEGFGLGWAAEKIDGGSRRSPPRSRAPQKSGKPSRRLQTNTIGYGALNKAGTAKAHGEALGADELKAAKDKLRIAGRFLGAGGCAEGRRRGRQPRHGCEEGGRLPCGAAVEPQAERIPAPHAERPAGPRKGKARTKKAPLESRFQCRESEIRAAIDALSRPSEFVAGSADLTGSNNNKPRRRSPSRTRRSAHPLRSGARHGGGGHERLFCTAASRRESATFRSSPTGARGAMRWRHLWAPAWLCNDARPDRSRRDGLTHQPSNISRTARHANNMRKFRPAIPSRSWSAERALNHRRSDRAGALTRQNLPQLRTHAERQPSPRTAPELVAATGEQSAAVRLRLEVMRCGRRAAAGRNAASVRVVSVPHWSPAGAARRAVRPSSATPRSRSRSRPPFAGADADRSGW